MPLVLAWLLSWRTRTGMCDSQIKNSALFPVLFVLFPCLTFAPLFRFFFLALSYPILSLLSPLFPIFSYQMVTIVDPHIAIDAGYYVYSDALSQNMFVRTQQGSKYEGWCWPGEQREKEKEREGAME